MGDKLKAGVIGIGSMGKNHARVYSELELTTLQAVSDIDKNLLNKFKDLYGVNTYENYNEMLSNEKLDLISIVVPNSLHKTVSLEVMAQNIPTLLEKPIASTVLEGNEIVDYAEKNNIKLMVGYLERFNPAIKELKKRLDKGELGKIYSIKVDRIGPSSTRKRDSGVLLNLGIHDLDIISFLINKEPIRANAEIIKGIYSNYTDLFHGLLRFQDNIVASLNVNWISPTKIRRLHVTGEKGMFIADYLTQDLYFYQNANHQEEIRSQDFLEVLKGVSEGNMIKYNIQRKEPLKLEIEHFVECIKNNKEPTINGREAMKSLKMVEILNKKSGNQK